jgi:hypothetical protein
MNYIRLTVKASRTWADTIDDGWNGSVSSAPAGKGGPLGGHAVRTQSQTKKTRKCPSLFFGFCQLTGPNPKRKRKSKIGIEFPSLTTSQEKR